ncbi:uncharacterized protein C5orf34 homolog isoform X1 [Pseudochaenichthys georgianus]|uniref:uncharacterized protein C5orf34 homolog isoform X1 n=1 Tax=Pseudochaenichthys georgianus TaxID=52239 RepID=UPI00146A266F|nr:uncharacterized protein C5orf34 homolog isoform X1 [Pseudochaenichthys georgianus]
METSLSDSLMIMYEDESVDVRYGNGAQLQMSPCGCEFMLVKPKDPSGHPLQPTERVRQRTRFTISAYKEFIVAALAFRNKYASRPYLPEELIPADRKKPFVSIDSDVLWPKWSSFDAELGPASETIIRSEEGRAALMLSASGDTFSVEFTSSLSQTQRRSMQGFSRDSDSSPGNHPQQQQISNLICQTSNVENKRVHQGIGSRRNESIRSRSCSPWTLSTAQPTPEEMYQSTTVVQHHSCCAVAPPWCYPLSLARHLWTTRLSKAKEIRTKEISENTQGHESINKPEISITERQSHLPLALPLTCPSPHWHRWKVEDGLVEKEHPDQDLPTELLKVMRCQGVTYRILSGTVSVIEVSPGGESVMRSNGVLNNYFTQHKLLSGQVKEVTYHLNSLPPDVPGQLYSVCSIVSRADRILACYNEAKQSLKLTATPSCLQEERRSSQPARMEEHLLNLVPFEQHVNVTQTVESRSDLVAAELEKIKRFNFLLENNHLITSDKGCAKLERSSPEEVNHEPVNEDCIAEALQKTSKAIRDIDALISAASLTGV